MNILLTCQILFLHAEFSFKSKLALNNLKRRDTMKIPEQILIITTSKNNPMKNLYGCFRNHGHFRFIQCCIWKRMVHYSFHFLWLMLPYFPTRQAEAQSKVDKKRDKLERKVLDSQERAFWDVHRPMVSDLTIKKMEAVYPECTKLCKHSRIFSSRIWHK